MVTWLPWFGAAVWSLAAPILLTKFFPNLVSKMLIEAVEQRNRRELARFKDELDRSAARTLEQTKGEIAATYGTLKSSMDFLSASQAGLREHSVEAVAALWSTMLNVRETYSALMHFERIFTEEERRTAIAHEAHERILRWVAPYADEEVITKRDAAFTVINLERHRPFCGEKLWLIFVIYRSLMLRSGYLMGRALKSERYEPLVRDQGIEHLMRACLPAAAVELAQRDQFNGLTSVLAHLEADFLSEAIRVMTGSKVVADSFSDMQATQRLHTREVADAIRGVRP